MPPRLKVEDGGRPIPEPYVCIAVQSTTQSKMWNNPTGWREIVTFLKDAGYRVICIDQKPVHGAGLFWNHIPHGVEDETGDRSLLERARWLKHAHFFVGLSSGLAWLAWGVGSASSDLISGLTHPTNDFYTPYRVINYHTCNSCWNDVRHRLSTKTSSGARVMRIRRASSNARQITGEQVKAAIQTIPGFGNTLPEPGLATTSNRRA